MRPVAPSRLIARHLPLDRVAAVFAFLIVSERRDWAVWRWLMPRALSRRFGGCWFRLRSAPHHRPTGILPNLQIGYQIMQCLGEFRRANFAASVEGQIRLSRHFHIFSRKAGRPQSQLV